MEIDPNAERNGYTAQSYIDALAVGLLPTYRTEERFMQDNTRIHKARLTMSLFEENDVRLVDFPPYSPDLNPIKRVWWALKREPNKRYPHTTSSGVGEESWNEFCRALPWSLA
jgi:transposase